MDCVKKIKGIGPKRAALLARLNIFTIDDLVHNYPVSYEDRSRIRKICQLEDGKHLSFTGRVSGRFTQLYVKKNFTIQKVSVCDDGGLIQLTWYNQPFVKNLLKPGGLYFFYGKIKRKGDLIEADNPHFQPMENEVDLGDKAVILPVYSLTEGLSPNVLRTATGDALDLFNHEPTLPLNIEQKYGLCTREEALRGIHFPKDSAHLKRAKQRLIFEEFFLFKLALLYRKANNRKNICNISMELPPGEEEFFKNLPFKPTGDQIKAIKDIREDMTGKNIMTRLVLGDVGSGKTLIAAYALFMAAQNNYQGLLMVPTGILASQQYEYINNMLSAFEIPTVLLTGQMKAAQRRKALEDIQRGDARVIVGTHSLISENITFNNVGLTIADEQHRFGVEQRESLWGKGRNPHVLVMTATPIPRTLAGTIYGDYDVSIIDEVPGGRHVKTYVVDESYRDRINNFMWEKLKAGIRVYVICPAVEEGDTGEIASVTNLKADLERRFSPHPVGLIHGRMDMAGKDRSLMDFRDGKTMILVSTVVVEVGVHVPEAGLMIIENAERFGLAQLHQLRGRIGRAGQEGWCILFNRGDSDISRARMKVMKEWDSGFDIARKDLELRGPGEFFGTLQHGRPDFKIALPGRDDEILDLASREAENIIKGDPFLERAENREIKDIISKRGN